MEVAKLSEKRSACSTLLLRNGAEARSAMSTATYTRASGRFHDLELGSLDVLARVVRLAVGDADGMNVT